jgi:hypothetical protein
MKPNPTQKKALGLLVAGVLDAVKVAGPQGAPSGLLYAALSSLGCPLAQYNEMMAVLVAVGVLEQHGLCYVLPAKGVAA